MEYILFGLSNGVFFGPPSEIVIWAAIKNGGLSTAFHSFVISNILGHTILFLISKRYIHTIESVILYVDELLSKNGRVKSNYERSMAWIHEPSGGYLFYGRLLPFFHTFTSIVAGKFSENIWKFMIFTIFGDYFFAILIYFHFKFFSKYLSDFSYVLLLLLSVALIHKVVRSITVKR